MDLKLDVKERKKAPPRPPPPIHVNSQKKIPHSYIPAEFNNDQTSVQSWEDARELFSVVNSMLMSAILFVFSKLLFSKFNTFPHKMLLNL